MYDESKFKESYTVARNLFATEENRSCRYESLLLIGKSFIQLWYKDNKRTTETFLKGMQPITETLLPFAAESCDNMLDIAIEYFQTLGTAFFQKSNCTYLTTLTSIVGLNGECRYNAFCTRQNLKKEYFQVSKMLVALFVKIVKEPDNKTKNIFEKENADTLVVTKCLMELSEKIKEKTIADLCISNFAALETYYDTIKETIKISDKKDKFYNKDFALAFLACEEEINEIILDENLSKGRILVNQSADIKIYHEKDNTTSTASRKFFVDIVTYFLNSTIFIDGEEISFISNVEEREKRIQKLKSYTDEIIKTKEEYEPFPLPSKEGIQPTSSVEQINQPPEEMPKETGFVNSNVEKTKEETKTNTFAIVAFIISVFSLFLNLLGIVGAVGAITSAISLKKIKDSGEKGKVFAYIGIIIGIYSVIYGIIQTVKLL